MSSFAFFPSSWDVEWDLVPARGLERDMTWARTLAAVFGVAQEASGKRRRAFAGFAERNAREDVSDSSGRTKGDFVTAHGMNEKR